MAVGAVARWWELRNQPFCPAFLYARPKSQSTPPAIIARSVGLRPPTRLTHTPRHGWHIVRSFGSAYPPTLSFGVVRASPPATFQPATPPPDPPALGNAHATPKAVDQPAHARPAHRLANFVWLATGGATPTHWRGGSCNNFSGKMPKSLHATNFVVYLQKLTIINEVYPY